jgi:hypothetical protein
MRIRYHVSENDLLSSGLSDYQKELVRVTLELYSKPNTAEELIKAIRKHVRRSYKVFLEPNYSPSMELSFLGACFRFGDTYHLFRITDYEESPTRDGDLAIFMPKEAISSEELDDESPIRICLHKKRLHAIFHRMQFVYAVQS